MQWKALEDGSLSKLHIASKYLSNGLGNDTQMRKVQMRSVTGWKIARKHIVASGFTGNFLINESANCPYETRNKLVRVNLLKNNIQYK